MPNQCDGLDKQLFLRATRVRSNNPLPTQKEFGVISHDLGWNKMLINNESLGFFVQLKQFTLQAIANASSIEFM